MVMPLDTPVAQLGFDSAEQSILTNAVAEMSKQHLLALHGVGSRYRSQGEDKVVAIFGEQTGIRLTVGDISSLEHASLNMSARLQLEAAGADTTVCCSCCPCCTCTASVVVEPFK